MKIVILLLIVISIMIPTGSVAAQEQEETILINEFFPNPDGADTGLEWLELFNQGTVDINLSKFGLSINGKHLHSFEEDELLQSASYLLLPLSKAPLPNCSSQPCTAKIELLKDDVVIHEVAYDKTANGKSWSRKDDNTWTLDYEPTPGLLNKPKEIIKTIQITEVYAAPNPGESEWVEIMNFGDKDINLEDWYITDKTAKTKLSGIVPANNYFVLEELSVSLNNTDEVIALFAPDNTKVDEFSYKTSVKGSSIIRLGSGLVNTLTLTPGAENSYTPVVVEEEIVTVAPQSKPQTIKFEPIPIQSINYLQPSNAVHELPNLITHEPIEIKTNLFGVYLLMLGGFWCWKDGRIRSYYNWWVTG